MTDEQYVRQREQRACVARISRRDGLRYQIVKQEIITTKLPPLGGVCRTEAAAWMSAADRMGRER